MVSQSASDEYDESIAPAGNALCCFNGLMKTVLSVFLFIIIAPLFAGAAPPKILPTEDVHDFGRVAAGPVLEHIFSFRNGGGQILIIRKVAST